MKRTALLKKIKQAGCELVRHGARHDWYRNPETGVCQPVLRHRQIRGRLAKNILAQLGWRWPVPLGDGLRKNLRSETAHGVFSEGLDPQHPRIRGRRFIAAQLTPASACAGASTRGTARPVEQQAAPLSKRIVRKSTQDPALAAAFPPGREPSHEHCPGGKDNEQEHDKQPIALGGGAVEFAPDAVAAPLA